MRNMDRFRGCLLGGAVGDALGYPVEFMKNSDIFRRYGKNGITDYERFKGVAQISDDTQMTLFTANGLLVGDTRGALRGLQGWPRMYVEKAYKDWLKTQQSSISEVNRHERYTPEGGFSWLLDVPELYVRRAPGNTCLSALIDGKVYDDYVKAKRNKSKGCGGIMRVAPAGIFCPPEGEGDYIMSDAELLRFGADIAAITHGHPLGYIPAGIAALLVRKAIYEGRINLKEIVKL